MLKLMRDNFQQLKWALLAVVAAFIVGFVFFDSGLGGPSANGSQDTRSYAARVNGETISLREYDRALYYTEKNYEQMYRQALSPEMIASMGLPKQVLDSLVDQKLLLQEARRLHLSASPEEVREKILQIPTLNPDGKFVGNELYSRYVTGSLGYQSPAEFEEELAREITLQKMESALAHSLVISPKMVETEYRRVTENAKIKYVLHAASREATNVTLTPAEIEQHYRAHQAQYAHGEQRQVKYLIADLGRLRSQIVPTDADLRKRYEASKEDFKHAEQAHILHLLIRVDQNAPPAIDAAAKAKAEGLVKQLRAGADFAKLAREKSDDPSSSGQGGDMGFVDKGRTVAPFDAAAFTIPLNTISDPIRTTEFGYHIIKVLERRPAGYRTFEEVSPLLSSQMAEQMAKDRAVEEITRIAARVKQSKPKTHVEFSAFANDKVTSNDTLWFAKNDTIPGLGQNPALTAWAFSAKPNDVGEIIGTQRGPMIPFLVASRFAGVSEFAEVQPKVESDARMEKARQAAAQALAKAMPAANIDAVSTKSGIPASETTVNHQGNVSGFSGDVTALVDAAMAAKVGEVKGPVQVAEGAVVFQVLEQKKVDPKSVDENRTSYAEMLRQQEARNLRAALLQRLRKDARVEINDSLLKAQAPQQQAGL
ncbi:MAG: SurA N-terminal domain-containing protein [Acidobacteriota bacterium]